MIGGRWLTEINVTSPTGIVAIDKFNGTDTPGLIWDAIERALPSGRQPEPMSDWVVRLIEQSGYLGVGFLMFLETMFPPIPSEVIMPVAGMAAAQGKMSFALRRRVGHRRRDARQHRLVSRRPRARPRPAAADHPPLGQVADDRAGRRSKRAQRWFDAHGIASCSSGG